MKTLITSGKKRGKFVMKNKPGSDKVPSGAEQLAALTVDIDESDDKGNTYVRRELARIVTSNGQGGRFNIVFIIGESRNDAPETIKLIYRKYKLRKQDSSAGKAGTLYLKHNINFTLNEVRELLGIYATIHDSFGIEELIAMLDIIKAEKVKEETSEAA